MALHQRLANADEMHDRKQLRLLVIGLLRRARVRKQPRDVRLAPQKRRRRARREQRIQLALAQHADQRLVAFERLEIEAGDRLERGALAAPGLLLPAVAPMDFGRLDAVFVLHQAAHPHHRGDLIFGQADALAAQVLRLADAGVLADIDAGMPENARHESGDADIGRGAGRHRAQIARKRQLRDVEFLEFEGAVENLFGIERQIGGRAALDPDASIHDRARAVIIAARNRYRHTDHEGSLSSQHWMPAPYLVGLRL